MVLVTVVHADISQWYGGDWCWVECEELGADDRVIGPVQVLLSVDAIPDDEDGSIPAITCQA